jgi:hypothetical protein
MPCSLRKETPVRKGGRQTTVTSVLGPVSSDLSVALGRRFKVDHDEEDFHVGTTRGRSSR